jgi:hypothetical protein
MTKACLPGRLDLSAPLSHERFKFDRFSAGAHFFQPSVIRMSFFGHGNQAGFTERRNVAA